MALEFIHKRNKVFTVLLAILFSAGFLIAILAGRPIPERIVFTVSAIIFYSLLFFVIRKEILVKPTMYFISTFLVLFATKSVLGDTNIVFYIAVLMFFTFISFYENFGLSVASAIILITVSDIALVKAAPSIFSTKVMATPDVTVFMVLNVFIYTCLILQNRASNKNRLSLYDSQEKIHHLAYHDALTGLPNRRSFEVELLKNIENVRKTSESLAVVFIDMDKFKYINDTFGHDVGDALLISVAERMSAVVGNKGICARLGGDEFVALINKNVTQEEVTAIGVGLLNALQPPFYADIKGTNTVLDSTPSIGISIYPSNGMNAEELIKSADVAMYEVKQNGKNSFMFAKDRRVAS
jgi:diguanylate cyclase (GGDEF)-like protein